MASTTPPEIPPPSLDDVLYRKDEGFAWITLNRPVVLNAVNWSIRRRLNWALNQARADNEVRAVILHGAGTAFCSGGDLQGTPPDDGEETPGGMEIFMSIWQFPVPVIAAVHGYAVGQGVELAGICDLTVAAESAKFGEIQIRHGFGPPLLITPYLTGPKQAKELLLMGEMVEAREAQRMGLVNRVVPDDQVLAEAEAMARKIASLSPKVVRMNKILVNRSHELAGFHAGLNYREDPMIKALNDASLSDDGMNEHLKILREQGWEAFRRSRDAMYQQQQNAAGSAD